MIDGAGEVETLTLSTGMGDLSAADTTCAAFVAETGMGDVDVPSVIASTAEISTGIGDPVTLLTVSLVLVVASALACLGPARRATRVEPTVALRID